MKIGVSELLLIIAVILVVFGPALPQRMVKTFQKTGKSFKEGMTETDNRDHLTSSSDDSTK